MSGVRPARDLPVVDVEPSRRGPDRRADRRLTYIGLGVAISFLVAALASFALPADIRLGWWLPLHLALAGAAGTAIAAMLPFFVAALAVAPPAPPALRVGALVLVGAGTIAGVAGRIAAGGGSSPVAAAGAAAYIAGMASVGLSAALSLRRGGGSRRPATELAYAIALGDVVFGVALVGLYLAGDPTVTARWAALRVGHAWLNLLGFVTLTVAGTLAHFVPTVVGSRIRRRPAAGAAVALLAVGAPLAAAGYALGPEAGGALLVVPAAVAAALGALALSVHGLQAFRDRFAWTTDRDWHRFTGGSLLAAPGWLLVAVAVAVAGVLRHGAAPQGWRLEHLVVPLVLGFVVQVLLGALAYLIPAVGPGTPAAHAAQRRVLGRLGGVRLWAWNIGVAAFAAGVLGPLDLLSVAGAAVALASGATTLVLLFLALPARSAPSSGSQTGSGVGAPRNHTSSAITKRAISDSP